MSKILSGFFLILVIIFMDCNTDEHIEKLLNSDNINEIIEGAKKAGDSGDQKYVPSLLWCSADLRTSTSMHFYGVSVYQAKMEALRKIFKKDPPTQIIFNHVDSTIIKFYEGLYKEQ